MYARGLPFLYFIVQYCLLFVLVLSNYSPLTKGCKDAA